jgi:hypothetical protein
MRWCRRCIRWSLAAVLFLGSTGCVLTRLGKIERPPPPEGTDVPSSSKGTVGPTGPGWKVVSGKREPHFLIAPDDTECMVSRSKWEKAALGSKQLCIWGRPTG